MIDMEKFRSRYGRIRYLDVIACRHPVPKLGKTDINRSLMIKFKYGNLTPSEEVQFHEAIKKMIYKVMHSNNVMMDWNDVYQEIWKKICKSRHTWKEWKGTMVSTWITIVANSVINTLRQTVNKYNSRFVLYDDLMQSNDDGSQNSENKCDAVVFESNEGLMTDGAMRKMLWDEQYAEFVDKLDSAEKMVLGIIVSMQDDILDAFDNRLKIPHKELRAKTGYDEATFAMIVYGIKRKYCETFNIDFLEYNDDKPEGDDSDTEFLF